MTNPVNPAGRRLLRVEARNAQVPIEKKPSWIRTKAVVGDTYKDVRKLVREKKLHTVCAEANCPNVYECWNDREATFLVGGGVFAISLPAAQALSTVKNPPEWGRLWPTCSYVTPPSPGLPAMT